MWEGIEHLISDALVGTVWLNLPFYMYMFPCTIPLQAELQEARLTLLDTLDRSAELDKLVYRLPFSQCMYLQSIFRLEAVR